MTTSQTMGKAAVLDAVTQVRRAKGLYAWLWLSPLLTLPTLGVLAGTVLAWASTFTPYSYNSRPTVPVVTVILSGLAVLGSGLWHLILLVWALDRQSEFVRWHGRQALLLAGARTAVALPLVLFIYAGGSSPPTIFWGVGSLLALWFFGTLWAQGQAGAGECSLMRWAGHGAQLPLRATAGAPVALAGALTNLPALYQQALALEDHDRYAEADRLFRQLLVSAASVEIKRDAADALPLPGQPDSSETADILVAMLRFSDDPGRRRAALDALEQAGLVEAL